MTDYIERETAVLSLLDKGQHSRRYKLGEIWELDFEEIREAIKSIPAADVRPVVRGKWERASRSLMACSSCGNCVVDDRISGLFFCPNCGADMRGEI